MSLFTTSTVTCPSCASQIAMEAVGSVNADRRPDLREDILKGRFQREACASCGTEFRLDPRFTYLDQELGLWMSVRPWPGIGDWPAACEAAQALFDHAYGTGASPAARDIGAGLRQRLVFGWPAVREKIALAGLGLDDGVLELAKIAILRGGAGAALDDGVELRLVGIEGAEMVFCWLDALTERVVDQFAVPRRLYDEIAADPAAWGALGTRIAEPPFVDMQKDLYRPAA